MARSRTTKTIAKRIDLNYFKSGHWFRRARRVLWVGSLLVALAWVVSASLRPSGGSLSQVDFIHNPGQLTAAHAFFQNDCRQCHAGSAGGGGFSRGVTDAACLKCHDAAMHHPNQIEFLAADRRTSSSCVTCHVEHRSADAMVGTSNAHCVICHADLPRHTAGGQPAVAASVTAFAKGTHPSFGASLRREGKWFDPTVLKFNHAKHLPMKGIAGDCVTCHTTSDPQVGAKSPVDSDLPPWTDPRDRGDDAVASSDRRYMRPVSYDRHCVGCHQLDLPAGAGRLSHEEMKLVRAEILTLPQALRSRIALDPARDEKLTVTTKEGRPPRVRTVTRRIGDEEWVQLRLEELQDAIAKASAGDAKFAALKDRLGQLPTTAPAGTPLLSPAEAALVEHFAAFGSANACNLCHEMSGQIQTFAAGASGATTTPATTMTSTAPARMATGPLASVRTGVPASPRRWFGNAQFDHAAHRNLACVSCHQQALQSTLTSDVLLPDIDTSATSCVACHHEPNSVAPGTPVNCVTCHPFHDRRVTKPFGPAPTTRATAVPTHASAGGT